MNKNELRKSALLQRLQYSEEACAQMSCKIADAFFQNFQTELSNVSYLHLFLPIPHKKEIDTYPIFHTLLEKYPAVNIVLSKCNFLDSTMKNFLYTKGMELKENTYGIPEPSEGKEIKADKIDLVLVPLVAIDHHGNRIGYGKGFYDRFLAECRPDCKKIGLSFEEPLDHIPADNFDIPLDFCITPDKIVFFKK